LLPEKRPGNQNYFGSEGHQERVTAICGGIEMKKEYDFSKAIKNPYATALKKSITIRLEQKTIDYFKALSRELGVPYQSLINMYLSDCAAQHKKLELKWA